MKRAARVPLLLLLVVSAGACTTPGSSIKQIQHEAPAGARYNLSGFSESFKQGYSDACASPSRRNDGKYKADTDYQLGWNDGRALCKK
jgi:hypothetical protein